MKKNRLFVICSALLSIILFTYCSGDESSRPKPPVTQDKDVEITSIKNGQQYTVGDEIAVSIKVHHPDLISDLKLYLADTLYADNLPIEDQEIIIPTANGNPGNFNLYLSYKNGAGEVHKDNRNITFFSDIVPKAKSISIVNTYPHDPSSYTQGLEFYNGSLFEGTGRKGLSLLAEVNLRTGTQLRAQKLDASIFGEGITVLNDTIYQISYQARKCFLYDMDFNKLTEFSYDGEGWGLTNDGTSLIMSNGSDRIVWRDPKTFQVTKEIQVFDHETSVVQLNELEMIGNRLYSNVYMENYLIEIDTASGKVLSYIDASEIVMAQPPSVDWLNGIAYDAKTDKIYLTGKLYPNLYEVSFK